LASTYPWIAHPVPVFWGALGDGSGLMFWDTMNAREPALQARRPRESVVRAERSVVAEAAPTCARLCGGPLGVITFSVSDQPATVTGGAAFTNVERYQRPLGRVVGLTAP
jgi:hypothetical protein